MRMFGLGLLAAMCLSFPQVAEASRIIDGPSTTLQNAPDISVDLKRDVALNALISPAMQWSQLEIDSVKAEGLNSSLPFAYTAEMAMKSELIHSYNVAQIPASAAPFNNSTYRSTLGMLMLLAGFTMWLGLSFQRRY